ncbi:hypothetical protein FRACA_780022 [Frankia canadensis]|uniref:Uncharacterized protein n=1 Tax=Frankia canadensis TaxID=1836972 RepID=A0A2I2L181_9ACTN|nr:hypothetical protein [Frankia canadensis]SNQ51665.1 hypothetical protein FRACA_780022 [Frankia canadensis]SOU58955.1 hypothetical protein FRACA_780022 [Frankia canadensis]
MLSLALLFMGMRLVLRACWRHPIVVTWLVGAFLIAQEISFL